MYAVFSASIYYRMAKTPLFISCILLFALCCSGSDAEPQDQGFPNEIPFEVGLDIPPKISVQESKIESNQLDIQFTITDTDSESVIVRVFGWHRTNEEYVDLTSQFSGDTGNAVATGERKTISGPISADYDHLKIEASNTSPPTLADLAAEVSKSRIKQDVEAMDGVRNFRSGVGLLTETRNYIDAQFQAHGLLSERQAFTYIGGNHENVIGTLTGLVKPEKRLQISGHFDTVTTTPGADDNASGTAGMLEAMRILSLFDFDKSIDFLGFDLEESGLIGSKRYISQIGRNQEIEGLINFEMIGYTCRSAECEGKSLADTSIYNVSNPEGAALGQAFEANGKLYAPGLKISTVASDGSPDYRRSDHAPYWDAGFDALFLTDGANFRNPHYHQTTDHATTLDFDFTSNIVRTAVTTIAQLAGWRDRGIAIVPLN